MKYFNKLHKIIEWFSYTLKKEETSEARATIECEPSGRTLIEAAAKETINA